MGQTHSLQLRKKLYRSLSAILSHRRHPTLTWTVIKKINQIANLFPIQTKDCEGWNPRVNLVSVVCTYRLVLNTVLLSRSQRKIKNDTNPVPNKNFEPWIEIIEHKAKFKRYLLKLLEKFNRPIPAVLRKWLKSIILNHLGQTFLVYAHHIRHSLRHKSFIQNHLSRNDQL
jgi:hypothetical protein